MYHKKGNVRNSLLGVRNGVLILNSLTLAITIITITVYVLRYIFLLGILLIIIWYTLTLSLQANDIASMYDYLIDSSQILSSSTSNENPINTYKF